MTNENDDLLNLCRLNEIEEHDVPDEMQRAVDWKKRQLIEKIAANAPVGTEEEMARHIAANIIEYPDE